ncbi:MAG: hypothetical protein ACRD3M_15785 [Thermoanaerobaculia bacterium]
MLTILVVGGEPSAGQARELDSALELLHARDAEEAVEKLGRNRRIDAVLILPPADPAGTVAAIREDNPSPPPVFLPAGAPEISGARTLASRDPERLYELLVRELS